MKGIIFIVQITLVMTFLLWRDPPSRIDSRIFAHAVNSLELLVKVMKLGFRSIEVDTYYSTDFFVKREERSPDVLELKKFSGFSWQME